MAVPYWSIVIPLTLLSAYLLLSKPRTKETSLEPNVRSFRQHRSNLAKIPPSLRLLKWQQITDQTVFTVGSSILVAASVFRVDDTSLWSYEFVVLSVVRDGDEIGFDAKD